VIAGFWARGGPNPDPNDPCSMWFPKPIFCVGLCRGAISVSGAVGGWTFGG
ncbi:hypothetical protein TNIN_156831, partial [Trichonephila inaurata madagascariensis]